MLRVSLAVSCLSLPASCAGAAPGEREQEGLGAQTGALALALLLRDVFNLC